MRACRIVAVSVQLAQLPWRAVALLPAMWRSACASSCCSSEMSRHRCNSLPACGERPQGRVVPGQVRYEGSGAPHKIDPVQASTEPVRPALSKRSCAPSPAPHADDAVPGGTPPQLIRFGVLKSVWPHGKLGAGAASDLPCSVQETGIRSNPLVAGP